MEEGFFKMRLKYLNAENRRKTKTQWGGGGDEYTTQEKKIIRSIRFLRRQKGVEFKAQMEGLIFE